MSTAHALALAETPARLPSLYGTRAQVAAPNGDVEGELRLAACDLRAGTASYALRVVNDTEYALRARMTCATMRGEPVAAFPLDVRIAPFSVSESVLPLRVAEVGPFDRAIVQVAGGNIAFSLDAPAPPKQGPISRFVRLVSALLALTIVAALTAAAATPRIGFVSAPGSVLSGNAVDVPYAYAGWASMQYALKTADGRQVVAGLAQAHEGTLHFTVPPAAGGNVVLSVNVTGPLGGRSLLQTIRVTPARAQHTRPAPRARARQPILDPPRIGEFAMATPLAHANGNVTFTYATNARDGEIWLIDEGGRLWLRAPISPYGTTTMKLPQGTAGRLMRAVLHARNGKMDAVASLSVTVLPDVAPADTPQLAAAHPRTSAHAPILTLSSENAGPGDSIMVAIEGEHGDAQISLNDAGGNSIEQGDIPAGQEAVTLSAPSVQTTTTFYVMANVSEGLGQQTLVKKLVVSPR